LNDSKSVDSDHLLAAWSEALAPVLGLLNGQQRGPFRQELQRYLAASRFQPNDVQAHSEELKDLLIQAARAASQPAAISFTREIQDSRQLVQLCEHLLALWRDAEEASSDMDPCSSPSGISGEVFFGPRLGGPGRRDAVQRVPSKASDTGKD
jgi:hypothetical protein